MRELQLPVSLAFSGAAEDYDALRRKLVPCFDSLYGAALELIAHWAPVMPMRILDLGAGTGLFSAMLLRNFPASSIRLVDASNGMLREARRRFAMDSNVEFVQADMTRGELGGPWDLVISALAIHHLADEEKINLFKEIRRSLRPGGLFVNCEQVAGPSDDLDRLYEQQWLDQVRALCASDADIAKAQQRMAYDRCSSMGDQLEWMNEAGLVDVDCIFKAWRFAVLAGKAPI